MANANAPFGLKPYINSGSPPTFEIVERKIASGNSTKIFTGDPVKRLVTGYVAQMANGDSVALLDGIFMGCRYLSVSQGRIVNNNYWPGADASGDVTALIYPILSSSPQLFLVQKDATTAAFADIGGNFDLTIGSGNTTNGRSTAVLAGSAGTTATLPWRLVDLWGAGGKGNVGPGTEAGAYNWCVVAANVTGTGITGLTA